jgi:hypothetical protein
LGSLSTFGVDWGDGGAGVKEEEESLKMPMRRSSAACSGNLDGPSAPMSCPTTAKRSPKNEHEWHLSRGVPLSSTK